MTVPAEQLLHKKVIEKLHVRGGEHEGRVDAGSKITPRLGFFEFDRKDFSKTPYDPIEHFPEMPILKLKNVDVHEQPEVGMFVDKLSDQFPKTSKALRLEGLMDLGKDRPQLVVDYRHVAV